MTAALLGVRLALTPAGRLRSIAMVVAMAIAQVLILGTAAACRAQLLQDTDPADEQRLALACATAIAIPCAVLVVTVARLAAAMRDRRLAGLRLVGLSPTQTRIAAATETGVAAVVGTALGYAAFALLRSPLSRIHVAGLDWSRHFAPRAVDTALAVVLLPLLAVAAAVLQRARADQALASARRADRRPPRLWRVIPLALGIVICVCVQARVPRSFVGNEDDAIPWMFAGIILLALGILLVVPVFVRLVAALLLKLPVGASTRLAARRLQAQPAGVARIVSVLLLGLFVVTGARYVLVDWEGMSDYQYAQDQLHHRQIATISTTLGRGPALAQRARAIAGVTDVLVLPEVDGRGWTTALVATCADIARMEVPFGECHEGQAYDLDTWGPTSARWVAGKGPQRRSIPGPRHYATVSPDGALVAQGSGMNGPFDQAGVVLPPSLVGSLPPSTSAALVVIAAPGRTLNDDLQTAGLGYGAGYDFWSYDQVQRLKLLVWTIAGVILAVGLLAFGLATIDRAVQRRKEITGLRLVGIDARTLRRTQWVEATVPIGAGAALAVVLGALGGGTYLKWGEDTGHLPLPWHATWLLVGVAVAGAVLVGAATVVAGNPRIRPEEIRAE